MATGRKSTENRFAKANQSLVSGNKSTEKAQTTNTSTTAHIESEPELTDNTKTKSGKNLKDLIKKKPKSRGVPKTIYFDADQYNKLEKFAKKLAKSENAQKHSVSKALKLILNDYFGE